MTNLLNYNLLIVVIIGITLVGNRVAQDDDAADVYFLADNTGSMGAEIENVRSQAKVIFNRMAAERPDIQFGVGAYKDHGDSFVYKNLLELTKENLDVLPEEDVIIKAMGQWEAEGGLDKPEAQLWALLMIATEEYEAIGWREGVLKVIVWFGDAPGHDPASRLPNTRQPVTEEFVTQALIRAGIRVMAFDAANMNQDGQAFRIANATGGSFQQMTRDQPPSTSSQDQYEPTDSPTTPVAISPTPDAPPAIATTPSVGSNTTPTVAPSTTPTPPSPFTDPTPTASTPTVEPTTSTPTASTPTVEPTTSTPTPSIPTNTTSTPSTPTDPGIIRSTTSSPSVEEDLSPPVDPAIFRRVNDLSPSPPPTTDPIFVRSSPTDPAASNVVGAEELSEVIITNFQLVSERAVVDP